MAFQGLMQEKIFSTPESKKFAGKALVLVRRGNIFTHENKGHIPGGAGGFLRTFLRQGGRLNFPGMGIPIGVSEIQYPLDEKPGMSVEIRPINDEEAIREAQCGDHNLVFLVSSMAVDNDRVIDILKNSKKLK